MPSCLRASDRRFSLGVVLVVVAAYLPCLRFGYLNWDDNKYVTENRQLREPGGLKDIWAGRNPEQYYPLTLTSFWVERQLWGEDARGSHGLNVALHAFNTWLVIAAARSLGMSGWASLLAGLLFGLHPMQVASVAWVTERKNVLSMLFYLLAFLAYRRSRRDGAMFLAAALAAFVAALLSKTAVVTLPVSLWLADVLVDRRPAARSFANALPLLACSVASGVLTILMEHRAEWAPLPWSLRPLVAAAAVWFYAGKLLVPAGLAAVYPKWAVSPDAWWLWAAAVGLAGFALLIWRARTRIDSRVVWGLASFVIALGPMLGLLSFGYLAHSYVADHFVYHASFGIFCAIAVVAERLLRKSLWTGAVALAIVAAVLGTLTVRQERAWSDSVTFWTRALERNPGFVTGYSNLGSALLGAQRYEEAAVPLREATRLRPAYGAAQLNLGIVLTLQGRADEAYDHFERAASLEPLEWKTRFHYGVALERRGRYADALREYRAAHERDKLNATVLIRLARLLAGCPDASLRNTLQAMRHAEQAVLFTDFADLAALQTLVECGVANGSWPEAAKAARRAAAVAHSSGRIELAEAMDAYALEFEAKAATSRAAR